MLRRPVERTAEALTVLVIFMSLPHFRALDAVIRSAIAGKLAGDDGFLNLESGVFRVRARCTEVHQ